MLHEKSSNAAQYREFLVDYLIPSLRPGCGKPILIYDQHTSHEADHVWPTVTRNFTPLPQVTYSSNFNSIETVWSNAKRWFFRRRIAVTGYLGAEAFYDLVAESLDQISAATAAGILNVNRAYIRSYLEKQLDPGPSSSSSNESSSHGGRGRDGPDDNH